MTTVFKVIGAILLIGTPGSLELDNITLYEAVLQGLLGVALLYGGIYIDEIKKRPFSNCSYQRADAKSELLKHLNRIISYAR